MNKTLYTLLLLPLLLAACDSDDNATSEERQLLIVSSQVFFPSQGGTGLVEVKSQQQVTAVLSADWCHAQVNDHTVSIAVQANRVVEGRSAILTIHSGTDSVQLTVQQRGIVYRFDHQDRYVFGDTAVVRDMPITYDNETQVTTSADWLTAAIDGDTLRYTCAENASGDIRSAWVRVSTGEYADSFKVMQYDARTDILGKYRLAGTVANGSTVTFDGTLSYTGKTLYFRIPDHNWNIAMTLDENEPTLYLKNTEYAGRYKADDGTNYYVSLLTSALVDGNFQLNLSGTYGMKAPLDYDADTQTIIGRFTDDGSWSKTGYTPNALLFWLTTARTPNSSNGYGYLQALVDPYLQRIK
ncbi:MAG: BACON domain-containing protein [Prevotella sp.]|nr:BACON domain-containing protein [Prevotella sp.]